METMIIARKLMEDLYDLVVVLLTILHVSKYSTVLCYAVLEQPTL